MLVAIVHGAMAVFSLPAVLAQPNAFLRGTTSPTRSDFFHHDNADAHIVGGDVLTSANRFPFFGTVEGAPILCGASLIWPDALLSAAHCVDAFSVAGRRVHIGGIYRAPWSDAEQTLKIRKHLQHPSYGTAGTGTFDYDIMLIFTHELAHNSTPLANVNTDPSLPRVGQELFMVGFGSTNDHAIQPSYTAVLSHTLKRSYETVVNDTTCTTSQPTDLQLKANHSLCTQARTGISCSGDSGGPLMNSNSTIMGLSSFGGTYEWVDLRVDGSFVKACSKNVAGYTRVSTFVPWIMESLCKHSKLKPDSCVGDATTLPVAPSRAPSTQPALTAAPTLKPPQQAPRLSSVPAPSRSGALPSVPRVAPLSSPRFQPTAPPSVAPGTRAPIQPTPSVAPAILVSRPSTTAPKSSAVPRLSPFPTMVPTMAPVSPPALFTPGPVNRPTTLLGPFSTAAGAVPIGKAPSGSTGQTPPLAPSSTSPSPPPPCRLGCLIRRWLTSLLDIF